MITQVAKRTQTHYPKLGEIIPVLTQRLTDEAKRLLPGNPAA
ncbi:hypothetical protein yberc0001_20380 [Yersinia bercovieri ATCC 43970]|uniref:Uncharacterized protein n=1 Tax=Yersinia bercovieri ATCC 43970 TaxID=349968 RepID=A0ABM9XV17_YERBE|nr:hypothetical protein yberc0001_20380 [Yersinia bercovieri ATCC 43970]